MLTTKANELVTGMKELVDSIIRMSFDPDVFKTMSGNDLDAIQRTMRFLDSMNEYIVMEAQMMDSMDQKLDKLLELANK